MEAVAAAAGERHSDAPRTACPVLAAFVRAFNDRLPTDSARTRILLPRVPRIVRTAAHPEVSSARAYAIADAAIRRFAARTPGAHSSLAALPEVRDRATATIARLTASPVRAAIREAYWTVNLASKGSVPAELWVGGTVRAAERSGPGWIDRTASLLDELIDLPRARALYWKGDPATRGRN